MKIKRTRLSADQYLIRVKDGNTVLVEWTITGSAERHTRPPCNRVWTYRSDDGEQRAAYSIRDIEHVAFARALLLKTTETAPA